MDHIKYLKGKLRKRIRELYFLLRSKQIGLSTKKLIYLQLIRPIWTYGCQIWGSAAKSNINYVQVVQNRVLRIITDAPWYVSNETLHKDLRIELVSEVIQRHSALLATSMRLHSNPLVGGGPSSINNKTLKRKFVTDVHLGLAL